MREIRRSKRRQERHEVHLYTTVSENISCVSELDRPACGWELLVGRENRRFCKRTFLSRLTDPPDFHLTQVPHQLHPPTPILIPGFGLRSNKLIPGQTGKPPINRLLHRRRKRALVSLLIRLVLQLLAVIVTERIHSPLQRVAFPPEDVVAVMAPAGAVPNQFVASKSRENGKEGREHTHPPY